MPPIDALGAGGSGLLAATRQLAASAHNLANLETTRPMDGEAFRGERLVTQELPGGGVVVAGSVPAGTAGGVPVERPDDPAADASGLVRKPDIDIGSELVQVLVAQRGVEANAEVMRSAVDAYRDLLALTNVDRERLTASG